MQTALDALYSDEIALIKDNLRAINQDMVTTFNLGTDKQGSSLNVTVNLANGIQETLALYINLSEMASQVVTIYSTSIQNLSTSIESMNDMVDGKLKSLEIRFESLRNVLDQTERRMASWATGVNQPLTLAFGGFITGVCVKFHRWLIFGIVSRTDLFHF